MAKTNQVLEDQSLIDTEAALAEISGDLFRQGEESGTSESDGTEGEELTPAADADNAQEKAPPRTDGEDGKKTEGEENSAEVQETGAPKTWTKEALAEWASVPSRVRQEIQKREEDFLRGITKYKEGADLGSRYDSVVEPFRPILAAENIDPVQLFQSFASNHYLLSRGTEEQKLSLAENLITGYGINFQALIDRIGNRVTAPIDPEIESLKQQIAQLNQAQASQQTAAKQSAEQQVSAAVDAFAADPAHPYFDELSDDIAKLLSSGIAADLQDAYDRAVYANPVTREKVLSSLSEQQKTANEAEKKARMDKTAKLTSADLEISQSPRNGTVPTGSIDDTLADTLKAIEARG